MKELSIPLRWYLFAVFILAITVTSVALYLPPPNRPRDGTAFLILVGVLSVIAMWPVRYAGRVVMFLATAIDIAAAWILSPVDTIMIMILGHLMYVKARNSWYKA